MRELTQKQQQSLFIYIIERIGEKNAKQVKEVVGTSPTDWNKLEALTNIKVEELQKAVK